MGVAPAPKAWSVCACGRRDDDDDDESWEIESAYVDVAVEGFWSVEWKSVVHEKTWLGVVVNIR